MLIKLFWIILTIGIYNICKKGAKFKIPPILSTAAILIIILHIFHINVDSYNESTYFITYLLGPATIALAYPLVKNSDILYTNKRALYFGFLFACITAIISTIIIGKLFHANFNVIISLIPKSVTTPVAVEISKSTGGIPEITACVVIFTGIIGAMAGIRILKFLRIKNDLSIGLSMGASSHVMGTSKLAEKKEFRQVAISTVSLIMIAILTSLFAPLFIKFYRVISNLTH